LIYVTAVAADIGNFNQHKNYQRVAMKSIFSLITLITMVIFCTPLCASFHFQISEMDTAPAFYTGYFTSFSYTVGTNLFQDNQGILHFAYVRNYELWYFRSEDDGKTWSGNKIPTGHDGDVCRAAITVNKDGFVFIAYTINQHYNYSNPSGVDYSEEFHLDLYCAHNLQGKWQIETLYAPTRSGFSDNYGPTVEAMLVDSSNNILLYANRVGWYTYGGTAWEYKRIAATNSWSEPVQAAHFTDQSVDHMIFRKYRAFQHKNGDITLIFCRHNNYELLYVQKLNGIWQTPVTIDNEIAVGYNRFNAIQTPDDQILLAYLKNNAQGKTQLLFSDDLSAGELTAISFAEDDTLNYFDLHCDGEGTLTMRLSILGRNNVLTQSKDMGSTWAELYELSDEEHYLMPGGTFVHSHTSSGYFSECNYYAFHSYRSGSMPYGPDTLFYGQMSNLSPVYNYSTSQVNEYRLEQNYPNPFNPSTQIQFNIPKTEKVRITIYNALGQRVKVLTEQTFAVGSHSVTFNAHKLASGVYYYHLQAGSYAQVKKMLYIQ
jgi:hypothetical protein